MTPASTRSKARSPPPPSVEFPRAFVGHPIEATVALTNRSRASRPVKLAAAGPFRIEGEGARTLAGGETLSLRIVFEPPAADTFERPLTITSDTDHLEVALVATAEAPPECVPSTPCQAVTFDPQTGACVETPLPEGAACVHPNACLLDTHCLKGACVGEKVVCDDGDPCTTDACDPTQGCVNVSSTDACPTPDDPCQVAFCDPESGCGVTDAVDGTSCGAADCVTAEVCISGACTTAPVPEGASCGEVTPCQRAGVCHDQSCDQPPPVALTPVWTWAPTFTAPFERSLQFLGVADDADNLYWAECLEDDYCVGAQCPSDCDLLSVTRDGALRWRVPAMPTSDGRHGVPTHQLISGGRLISFLGDSIVEARRLTDGALIWSRNFPKDFWHYRFEFDQGGWVDYAFGVPSADGSQVLVPYDSWYKDNEGQWVAEPFLAALDLQTGATRWKVALAEHDPRSALDEAGTLYVTGQTSPRTSLTPAFALESFTSTGLSRWGVSGVSGDGLVVADGAALVDGLASYGTGNGASSWSDPEGERAGAIFNGAAYSFLVAPGSSLNVSLTRRNVSTGEVTWTMAPDGINTRPEPFITSTSDVLFLSWQFSSRGGGGFAPWLRRVEADGEDGFWCELEASGISFGASVLLDERWVAVLKKNDRSTLMAFDVPGLKLANTGWVAPRGDFTRSGAPR